MRLFRIYLGKLNFFEICELVIVETQLPRCLRDVESEPSAVAFASFANRQPSL